MKKICLFTFLFLALFVMKIAAQGSIDTFSYKFGQYEIILLSEGQQQGKSEILLGVTPQMMEKYVPNGTFPNATNAFLLKTPDKNILIDTGLGKKLINNLNSVGVSPADIDIILITHMHGDHIGGMLKDGEVIFSKAEVYISQPERDYWMGDEAMNAVPENKKAGFKLPEEVINKYADRIHLFQPYSYDKLGEELLKGIYPVAAYGHTPGHTAYLIESGVDKLLVWGDLTHAMAIQMPLPEIAVTYDVNPEDAIRAREEILDYVFTQNISIAGMHIAYPAIGDIEKADTGYEFLPK